MSQVNVFLDLEGTIIDEWCNPVLVNVEKVKHELEKWGIEEVGIFSFAICNEQDVATFQKVMQRSIENALGVTINPDLIITGDDMLEAVQKKYGLAFETWMDFVHVKGKDGAFVTVCLEKFKTDVNVLIDDVVPDMTIMNHTSKTTVCMIPVNTL